MSNIMININGKECSAHLGQTVVDVATQNNIEIPTLCNDDRVEMYGSCGVCVVEAEHSPRLIRACSTLVFDGMVIKTDTERVFKTRQSALELMLSDHVGDCKAPCQLACPGETDCQGYVGLVALGEYEEALKLVKNKIPLPGSIGRVCPHPCEDACRRHLVEEPISIAFVKSFLGDMDMENEKLWTPEVGEATGKKVAIIGGGPGGLTAAYFLRQQGHAVEVFDKMPKMGGMLYYGIPEYRLPKDYLSAEVNSIRDMDVTFHNNVLVGKDYTLEDLNKEFDATIVATGAWISSPLRCPGEDLNGVIGGIDFLREITLGNTSVMGKNVAIVGGGNTAMDACRTAVRLGAENVYNIYRRTRNEMPAEEIEIIEAEEEGVIFKNLTNPIEVLGKDGSIESVRLQIMELGEPDDSGRRRPVPVEGKEEVIKIDTLIVAIGQKTDSFGLDGIELTKWDTILADENDFTTNIPGVFALGDATNNGADIAITAMGEAKKAVKVIDSFINGHLIPFKKDYVVTQELLSEDFAHEQKTPRMKMPHKLPNIRRDNFLQVNHGFTTEMAKAESSRCLECGCHDYFECKLIRYANQYDVAPEKYEGDKHNLKIVDEHPFIQRNPDKCILCGLCVRICREVVGETALGLVGRGFDATVMPALNLPLKDSGCISCGQCVAVCPTGALLETMQTKKQIPTAEKTTVSTCSFCSVGCQQELTHTGDTLIRALPYNEEKAEALLCVKGRFGFGEIAKKDRVLVPMLKEGNELTPLSLREASVYTAKKLQAIQSRYGNNSVGVAISSRYTNQEALAIKEYAKSILETQNIFSFGESESGLSSVLGKDASTVTFSEMEHSNLVISVEFDMQQPHLIAGLHVKKTVENGAKLLVLNSFVSAIDDYASKKYNPGKDLSLLKEILKVVIENSTVAKDMNGFDRLKASLKKVTPSSEAKEIASAYLDAKKAVIIFEQSKVSKDCATLLANISLASGKAFSPRSGIIQLKSGANSQGLADINIVSADQIDLSSLKGLVVFGENPPADFLPSLDFLAVHELHMTETARKANIVIPAQSFAEVSGTFTNTVGNLASVNPAIKSPVEASVIALVNELTEAAEKQLYFSNEEQLSAKLEALRSDSMEDYTSLVTVADGILGANYPITNELTNSILSKL